MRGRWTAAHCCKPRHGFSPPRGGPRGAPEAAERDRLLIPEAGQREAGNGRSLSLRQWSGVVAVALAPVTWRRGWPARPRLGAPAAQCPGQRPQRDSSPEPGASCGPLGAADSGAGAEAGAAGPPSSRAALPRSWRSPEPYSRSVSPTLRSSGPWAPELECSRSTAADPAALE